MQGVCIYFLAPTEGQTGSLSLLPKEAPYQTQTKSFSWPAPPYAIYTAAKPWAEPQVCDLEGLNGAIRRCTLVSVTPAEQTILIQIEHSKTPVPVTFSQFRRLTLKKPIHPQEIISTEQFADILGYRSTVQYNLLLENGSTATGQTVGYVETHYGLFLFTPLDAHGSVERVFVPRDAFTKVTLGDHIGQMLVEQKVVTSQQVEDAATEQDNLRKRKLGDYLVDNAVVSPEQLMLALDQQSKMPMIRVGEALTRLGYIDETQLKQALEKQKTERSVPLGQLLVNMGFLTRADLNIALARKMGYPVVDVTKFPVDPEALKKYLPTRRSVSRSCHCCGVTSCWWWPQLTQLNARCSKSLSSWHKGG